MTNYFENVKTSEELKAAYKELVKKYHPDVYGEAGNEILKEIHKQLEKTARQIDKGYFDFENDYNDTDREESEEIRAKKVQFAKEAQGYIFPEGYMFLMYWQNAFRPANHRNPLTKHNFTGWNVWQLEIEMLLNGYNTAKWSTFPQYKNDNNSVKKGEHGARITLAIHTKKEDENGEEKTNVFFKGYTVFNIEQTEKGATNNEAKQIENVKLIETISETTEQKKMNLWSEKYEVVA